MKRVLCIVSNPPYANTHSLELIETAMVGAVFDFKVSILFRDEGVWSLLKNQDASPLQQRTLANVLTALPTYDVENIYVCANSAEFRNLAQGDFAVATKPLSMIEQANLIAAQDAVIGAQS
jgi:tRNA 2-thiouridine synthesizing protein C